MDDKNYEFRGFDMVNPDSEPAVPDSEPAKEPKYEDDLGSVAQAEPAVHDSDSQDGNRRYHQQYEYSYTPPRGFFSDSGYGDYGNRGPYYQPPQPPMTPPRQPVKAPQPRRERKPVGVLTLVACMLLTAVLGGAAGAGGFAYYTKYMAPTSSGTASGSTGSAIKNITIETTTENLIEAVSEKVGPSVVGIRTTASSLVGFWGNTIESTGEGSGIIYKSTGYIITNYHVIQQAVESTNRSGAKVEVFLPSNVEEAIPATVVGYDISTDLAVLKIERTELPAIEIGDSDKLKVGETAVAVGNPGGLEFMGSVSAGIISGLNRVIQLESTGNMTLIQTDAAINPGNSGGALVNAKGQLIGVNSAKMASDGFEGMGFAIPVNHVVEICQNIIDNKDVKKAFLGLQISTVYDAESLRRMGYPAGVVIQSVVSGGPCDGSGIKRGDILTKIGEYSITSFSDYNSVRSKLKPGEKVTLTVYRGKYYSVEITLGESNS